MFWHLKEGMHLPKKGRQMSLAVSEGQKNRNPGGGKTTRGGKSSSRWQFVFPGQVLLVQIQRLVQVRGVGRLCPGDNRAAAEGSRGDVRRGAGLQGKEYKRRGIAWKLNQQRLNHNQSDLVLSMIVQKC